MKPDVKLFTLSISLLLTLGTMANENVKPVAHIQTAVVHMEKTTQTITAYGRIVPAADGAIQVAARFGCRIIKVLAADGQTVKKGDLLFEVAPGPDSQSKLDSTRQALAAAKQDLTEANARFKLKLADRQEVLHARQAVKAARLRLDNLTAQGLGGDGRLKAPCNGFIQQVDAKAGDLLGVGASLATIGRPGQRELIVGVDPGKAARLKIGQTFTAHAVLRDDAKPLTGHILRIGHTINPKSGLVQTAASLDGADALATQEYMEAHFDVNPRKALVIPASAVLPDGNDQIVYTVVNGKAVHHSVKTEPLSGNQVRLVKGDIKAGDKVVTLGNYELEDGMKVTMEGVK